ncbi:MAG: U32 family peptidase [Clostridia bacterium]|nr:U32 family peptidase [Clostridia bacterium]
MEILAPAGSWEALERAQAAGADAVYLGYAAFSARAGAGNFDESQLREALAFAHLHHMRVYVTVNTLVKDGELPEVYQLLRLLNQLRVDGVLVQDLGVLRLARKCFPDLRIHASTQMAIHNETGVRWCQRLGMKRVVLARECSLAEIQRCVETGMEIEVFGHGAQCVSVSGECLFSSMVGERSGNRGRCAQPCRKKYRLAGQEGAWLSPRDLCLRDRMPEMATAGVASLKIEGRLKRPEYVYTVAGSYARGKDSLEAGAFQPLEEKELDALRQVFHRGGFMEGYAFGAEDAGVIDPAQVNHQGLYLGQVAEAKEHWAWVRLERDLHDGDGLRLKQGTREMEMTYAGPDLLAGEMARLRLREGIHARVGDQVWRLTDARQLAAARTALGRKIQVQMLLEAWPGKPLRLQISDGKSAVEMVGEEVAAARTREMGPEEMEKQLRKTGGTDFEAAEITIRTAGAFVPVAVLNELRREGLERLAEKRRDAFAYPLGREMPWEETKVSMPGRNPELPERWVTVQNLAQAEAAREAGTAVIWYPEDFRPEALEGLAGQMEPGEWLRLPEVCQEETLAALQAWCDTHRELLGGLLLGSVGQLGRVWPVPVAAGPGIPVMNREAARMLEEEGCLFDLASPELTGAEWKTLGAASIPLLFPVYGRTQLMLLHHCPARTALGCRQGHGACRLCDEGSPQSLRGKTLEDERGYCFPLERKRLPEGCLVRLLNALPTDLGDRRLPGGTMAEMTTETGEETREILSLLEMGQKTQASSTRGHWSRPVL